MLGQISAGRLALAYAASLLTCGVANDALAQITTSADLAQTIENKFGQRYSKGKVGNDWCYNVDTERGYNWWYYNLALLSDGTPDPTGLQALKVGSTARIQATYDGDNGIRTYSSVFLGLQAADNVITQLGVFDLNHARAQRAQTTTEPNKTGNPPTIAGVPPSADPLMIPDSSNSDKTTCMPFAKFLEAYFLPNQLDPSNTTATDDKGSFATNYATSARWWMFKGRGHQVFNITSYAIKINLGFDTSKPVSANLVVGFGGGAGP